ncbi:hypothetical protein [Mycolicibacterium wolinskyi]|uniref:hypothetical protein n=1 Tax=Mycolicibacterium wolinskyi TaxID=59750 RepID=UPI000B331ADF|nr:hypothetical protein [Mycolicibacterium wolinskyi]
MAMVISDSRTERGTIRGDVYVRDGGDLTLRGMILGTLTVGAGGYAHVHGTVEQLVVRDAGRVELDGTCTGDARNLGGELIIRGTVKGSVIGYYST